MIAQRRLCSLCRTVLSSLERIAISDHCRPWARRAAACEAVTPGAGASASFPCHTIENISLFFVTRAGDVRFMAPLARRDLLRLLAAAGGASALAGCGDDPVVAGDDEPPAPDADPAAPDADVACRPTTGDAQGPFFEPGAPMRTELAGVGEPGDRLVIAIEVFEEGCAAAANGVLVDVWQADRDGNYYDAGRDYRLRGQVVTPRDGRFEI